MPPVKLCLFNLILEMFGFLVYLKVICDKLNTPQKDGGTFFIISGKHLD